MSVSRQTPDPTLPEGANSVEKWSYDEAFCRNDGLISAAEQQRLRKSRVAIAGMGGVGGVHLVTLARLGVGAFHIADFDKFGVANFNRQYGADVATIGKGKAAVMADKARTINPDVDLRVFDEAITADNVDEFLDGVDLVIDGIDFFSIEARRNLFAAARQRNIWAITAGPIGFSTAWLTFDPKGMPFDTYFDVNDSMDRIEQLVAFSVGLSPRATQLSYFDLSRVDLQSGAAPSVSLACQLASGVAATEAIKILLDRSPIRAAPCYTQFDAYRQIIRKGRLLWGNRGPLQRLKRKLLARQVRRMCGP